MLDSPPDLRDLIRSLPLNVVKKNTSQKKHGVVSWSGGLVVLKGKKIDNMIIWHESQTEKLN